MPQQFPELAFVAIDARPHRPDGRERIGAATGPGWFESSWDLCHGLEVREGWSDDERVHGWIEDFLSNQRCIDRSESVRPGYSPLIDRCALAREVNEPR